MRSTRNSALLLTAVLLLGALLCPTLARSFVESPPSLLSELPWPHGLDDDRSTHAARRGAAQTLMTDATRAVAVPITSEPSYMSSLAEPTFGTELMRITGDTGASIGTISGSWGPDARHVYSKQQPWNSDNTLLSVQNHGGGAPSVVILDGSTYRPKLAPCANYARYDYRWHPSRSHPHEQINVDPTGNELMWFDVTTCTKTRTWTLPITVDYGIGSGEGNPSADGRFVALGNNQGMFIVDMDPQPPAAGYPSKRIGPVYTFPPCSLSTTAACTIGNLSVSPSGRYVDVKYSSTDSVADAHRIYEIDPVTLALRPHNMATSSPRCGSYAARPNGWIFPLKHADLALDPFDANEDVIIGGRSCPGSAIGHVVKVRLRDGKVTALTDPNNEASVAHVSTRNLERPGWAYVSFFKADGKRFSDEIVAVKLDGSLSVERYTHTHTAPSGCYRCEAHPVPSRDGQRVLFASNWAQDCGTGCGSTTDIKDYVVWSPTVLGAEARTPVSAPSGVELAEIRPNPAPHLPLVAYSLADDSPAVLELFDVAGRTVLHEELGKPGAGTHELELGRRASPGAGVYWLRLRQAGHSASRAVVLTR